MYDESPKTCETNSLMACDRILTIEERLQAKRERLQAELQQVIEAQQVLQQNPGVASCMTAIQKALGR